MQTSLCAALIISIERKDLHAVMAIKLPTYLCVVLFGSASWLSINAVWMELPLLTDKLPEGWGLPSYLTVLVQIACIGSLICGIIRKFYAVFVSATTAILALLIFCCICTVLLALFWSTTVFIFGEQRSVVLMILISSMAFVDATSNLIFMPYMATFHQSYLTAYFVGMGLSALFPSIISIIQGSGSDCIVVNGTSVQTKGVLRFGVTEYNFIMFGWLIIATIAFLLLSRTKDTANSSKQMNQSSVVTSLPIDENDEFVKNMDVKNDESRSKKLHFRLMLLLMAVINAQMNGIVPSVQSFASLPYSQSTYHLGLTLSNIISPVVCFLPLIVTISQVSVLVLLTIISSILTAVIVAFAAMSPTPILQFSVWGNALIVIIIVCSSSLNSFLRTVLAAALNGGGADSEKRLFWVGVSIQIGSLLGSFLMFPLVNVSHVFVPAPPCP